MDKNTAIQILTDLSNGVNIPDKRWGACKNFRNHPLNVKCWDLDEVFYKTGHIDDYYYEVVECWPMFSGRCSYPVPHPIVTCPETAYDRDFDKWNFNTVYGQNRKAFCLYLIEVLKNES